MCRLLGVVASAPVDFRPLLVERRRSLAVLGEEHPDGWGVAAFGEGRWRVHKGTAPASRDAGFRRRAAELRGEVLVSHVRKRTVGETRLANTHPFRRGGWIFAHNGTIQDRAHLRAHVSPKRAAEIRGDTDSELFFAFLLTRLDEAGVDVRAQRPACERTNAVLSATMRDCRARPDFGSASFLLSNGATLYAHRFGRTLHVLERGTAAEPSCARRPAVFVASEPTTDEAWREVADGSLLRVDAAPRPLPTPV
jgi:glutamine amidotransferase